MRSLLLQIHAHDIALPGGGGHCEANQLSVAERAFDYGMLWGMEPEIHIPRLVISIGCNPPQ